MTMDASARDRRSSPCPASRTGARRVTTHGSRSGAHTGPASTEGKLMVRLTSLLVTLSLVGCSSTARDASSTSPSANGCGSDADCKGDRVCVDRTCVDPDRAPASSPGSGSPLGAENASEWCAAYSEQCPKDDHDVQACIAKCSDSANMRSDDCWFRACAVDVRKCEDEEPGDATIIACGETRGWRSKD